jgi:two-component system, cell cycle response regulator DivK
LETTCRIIVADMGKKILLFEDDEQLIELLHLILKINGYEIRHRSNCNDVVQDVKNEMPDLVLMDLRIPDIGGMEATKLIKNDESLKNIPVIIVSADMRTKEKATLSGADGYIVKPFEIADFEEVIFKYTNA